MTNPPPEDRKVNDTQIIDGKMSSWNGKGWEVPPENDVWLKGPGELYYWDGKRAGCSTRARPSRLAGTQFHLGCTSSTDVTAADK